MGTCSVGFWLLTFSRSAARAYKQAMTTLATLRAHSPQHTSDPSLVAGSGNSKSIFSSFLPNLQGQGPIASAVRIILKLHHYTFRRISNRFSQEGLGLGSKKKDDELRGKAIKVVDLLQHSAELGNMDALYTLAQISLVIFLGLFSFLQVSPSHAVPSNTTFPPRS